MKVFLSKTIDGNDAISNCVAQEWISLSTVKGSNKKLIELKNCSYFKDTYIRNATGYVNGSNRIVSALLGNDLTGIGQGAFIYTSISSITIPENVTTIERNAFYGCNDLTSFTNNDKLVEIQNNALNNCSSIVSVAMPSTVVNIIVNAFDPRMSVLFLGRNETQLCGMVGYPWNSPSENLIPEFFGHAEFPIDIMFFDDDPTDPNSDGRYITSSTFYSDFPGQTNNLFVRDLSGIYELIAAASPNTTIFDGTYLKYGDEMFGYSRADGFKTINKPTTLFQYNGDGSITFVLNPQWTEIDNFILSVFPVWEDEKEDI